MVQHINIGDELLMKHGKDDVRIQSHAMDEDGQTSSCFIASSFSSSSSRSSKN